VDCPAREDINADFPLRGFVECDDCGQRLTACWTKGRNARYPYYLCQTKDCCSFGKSIKRDVLEDEFKEVLAALSPSHEFYELATEMFRNLWNARVASAQGNRAQLVAEVTTLEKQIEQFVDRIVNADSDALIGAHENRLRLLEAAKVEAKEKIANYGRPLADFDTNYRTAMELLENPSKMLVFGDLVDKRASLKLTFEGRIRYKGN
jgi:site-specific DNA recombinase